ncbi:hypothetical protein [Ruminiclostridium papyrosolvens]|uniref:Uncharacterized protein n=1 Tax=Ruminiclostridium papyrosolvens C7 TaxID=1330534 RepID=U4R2Q2_9FIRM|nr:hypothetical protein [Ruminiclostridium papyrosolvens]EPR12379.1 hypothetical protein L323_08790 [Ruminiclostridium papyrosolvens C7]
MAINMMCEKSECKHYFEDCCMKNLIEERIHISEDGYCLTYEPGVNDAYKEIDKMADGEIQAEQTSNYVYESEPTCNICGKPVIECDRG